MSVYVLKVRKKEHKMPYFLSFFLSFFRKYRVIFHIKSILSRNFHSPDMHILKHYQALIFLQSATHIYGILYSSFRSIGAKYPLIQFGFMIHICVCVFSTIPAPGYTGFPSVNTPLTESYCSAPLFSYMD